MDHDHALRIAAVEKFLLNELPQDERDQFEEHFFDCQECALDLRAGAVFLDQVKKQLESRAHSQSEPIPAKKWWLAALNFLWRPALIVPALAILLLAVGYQDVVTLPRLERKAAGQDMPQILPTISLLGANSRGGELPSINAGGRPFLLLFDIPDQASGTTRFSHYTCSLYSPSGTLLFRTIVSAAQARNTISLRVPRLNPGDGVYSLSITGDSSMSGQVNVARYPFRLSRNG